MDPAAINTFLDQFIAIVDSGFGLIQGDVAFVLNALIVISITLAGAQWALSAEAPMAHFFRKVLFVGLFAFLINNWNALSSAINQSGAMLGLRAGGGTLTLPGQIAEPASKTIRREGQGALGSQILPAGHASPR